MSEHPLSDDFSRWPRDPFELLGVARGVSERDLRRAYAHLIRVYKPEQFPEQFRRIREAYEAARQYASYYQTFEPPPEAPLPAADPSPAPETDRPEPRRRSFEEELDAAWDHAVEGDEARAYAWLLELDSFYPRTDEVCLRLYSLLRVAPELDAGRTPCDWLADGLRRKNGSGSCHELYRREIEDNPPEALTERFARLLAATTQPGLLATFVGWRWTAAGRLGRFEVIEADLPELRARLAVAQEEVWLRMLASAADQLAWAAAPSARFALAVCLEEVAQLTHLHLKCPEVFDRLECLEKAAAGWHVLTARNTVPADLLAFLRRFSTRPFPEVRRQLTHLLAAIDAEPAGWLWHLDRINDVSPTLLGLFGKALDSYQWTLDLEDHRDRAQLTLLAADFLEEHKGLRYSKLRTRLLTFCLRERIDPEVFAVVAASQMVVVYVETLVQLTNDWPLRLVYLACKLFRG